MLSTSRHPSTHPSVTGLRSVSWESSWKSAGCNEQNNYEYSAIICKLRCIDGRKQKRIGPRQPDPFEYSGKPAGGKQQKARKTEMWPAVLLLSFCGPFAPFSIEILTALCSASYCPFLSPLYHITETTFRCGPSEARLSMWVKLDYFNRSGDTCEKRSFDDCRLIKTTTTTKKP